MGLTFFLFALPYFRVNGDIINRSRLGQMELIKMEFLNDVGLLNRFTIYTL